MHLIFGPENNCHCLLKCLSSTTNTHRNESAAPERISRSGTNQPHQNESDLTTILSFLRSFLPQFYYKYCVETEFCNKKVSPQ